MKTERVLNIIEKVAASEGEFAYFTSDEALVALVHAYYYVKPEDTERFMFMLNDIVERGERLGLSTYKENNGMLSLSACNKYVIADFGSQLAKDCFNWEYYTSQMKTVDIEEEYDENLLAKYVYQLDEEKMKDFLTAITALRHKETGDYYFMSDDNKDFLELELHYADAELDASPSTVQNLYLKRIADALVEYIDKQKVMAGHLARMMHHYNKETACAYLEFALYCEEVFEVNPFDDNVLFRGFSF